MAKIIAITLTLAGRSSDLKLEMLEAVETISTDGRIYRWGDYVADMIKTFWRTLPRDERNHQVPLPNPLDRCVPYLSGMNSSILGTDKVPHEQVQTLLPERNPA